VQGGSGTAVSVRATCDALRHEGHDVTLLSPASWRPSITLRRWWFNRSLRVADLEDFDVVVGIDGDAARAALAARRPYVASLKGVYPEVIPFEGGLTRRLLRLQAAWERRAARSARIVVVPSGYSALAVERHYGVPRVNLRVVPEPFDVRGWRAALPNAARTAPAVLCVAHLYPRKRVLDLVRAWPLVLRAHPEATLRIIGHGPQLAELRRRAGGLESVSVEGHVDAGTLLRAYAEGVVLCLPSAQENFGIAVVEAMASGMGVVVSDAGALPETTEGAVRWLTPVGDAEAIAAGIGEALGGGARARAAATNPRVAARYEAALVGERLAAVLREAAAG
jgi:glycosyltransferase involved in cell wall biosynthesis